MKANSVFVVVLHITFGLQSESELKSKCQSGHINKSLAMLKSTIIRTNLKRAIFIASSNLFKVGPGEIMLPEQVSRHQCPLTHSSLVTMFPILDTRLPASPYNHL